ncbi:MAG TPA: ABC transporter ATP-binding protein [Anaerolineales bacterium]|jgi:branched-chain amino acid transport system ATP-binding protein|nr:ABC transporter ATP-binding protein [Anaerolineales bacterium]
MPLLQTENLTIFFGGLRAVHNFQFSIELGQVRGLIGPNGAGKTTIFNLITGIHKPTEGKVIFSGKDVVGLRPYEIAAMGIGRTFQNMRLWRHMTVLEHIKMARYSKLDYGLVGAFFGTSIRHREEDEAEKRAFDLMELFGIRRFADHVVTGLPYGIQRRVEMARAMAMEPKLLLLDEPTAGMNPEELSEMVAVIRQIKKEFDLAIFLIEHRMKVVMDLCERIQTLDFGEVIAEGTPEEIRSNSRVIDAYLGKEAEI